MDDNEQLLKYYIEHAITLARKLSIQVRTLNKIPIDPTSGDSFKLLPVYEPGYISLLDVTQKICETKIICVDSEPKYVDAYWKKYNVNGVISSTVILTDQDNYCFTRFFACKELMHNYLHETGSSTKTNSELRNLIINLVRGGDGISDSAQTIVDNAAYYGALEYLMPKDTIPLAKAIFENLVSDSGEEEAYKAIAFSLRIPLALVEYRFANDDQFDC